MNRAYSTLLTILTVILLNCTTYAQRGSNQTTGTKSLSLGGISSIMEDGNALLNNFSNTIFSDIKSGIILSSERRFFLEELTSAAGGYYSALGSKSFVGISVDYYGFSEYKESSASLSYARQLTEKLSISGNFDFNQLNLGELGSKSHITYGIGLSGIINESLSYGVYLFNPTNFNIKDNSSSPSYLQISIRSNLSKKLALYSELEKVIDESVNVKLGLQYAVEDSFGLRLGFNTNPGQPSLGFYFNHKNFVADLGINYDLNLGVTPSVTINYTFSK